MKRVAYPITYYAFTREAIFYLSLLLSILVLSLLPLNLLAALSIFLFVPVILASAFWFKNGGFWAGIVSAFVLIAVFIAVFLANFSFSPLSILSFFLVLLYPVTGWYLGQIAQSVSNHFSELEQHRLSSALSAIYTKEYLSNLIRKYIKEYERYKSNFSIILMEIDPKALEVVSAFRREHILSEIASIIRKNIRTIDELGRYESQFLMVLPHTPFQGCQVVEGRIKNIILKVLQSHGCESTPDQIYAAAVSYPENKQGMEKLLHALEEPISFSE